MIPATFDYRRPTSLAEAARLLAAHATVTGLALVTKDNTILQHLPLAWWAE